MAKEPKYDNLPAEELPPYQLYKRWQKATGYGSMDRFGSLPRAESLEAINKSKGRPGWHGDTQGHREAALKGQTDNILRTPMTVNKEPWQMTLGEYWAKKFNGLIGDSFSKENIKLELRGRKELLSDVISGRVRPSRIVGTGYKYPKKAAIEWLESKIKELQDIIDGKAMDEIAVANHAFHVREAIKSGKPVPEKVLAQYPELMGQ